MKRVLAALLVVMLVAGLLSGCGAADRVRGDKPHIVTTIFPIWDWTRQVLGEQISEVELTMLLDDGVDMHSFQPSVSDLVAVSDCDLLIYVGGESDEWISDALAERHNPDLKALNLMEVLGSAALTEELVEGMEGETEDTPDEHIWLSLRNAEIFCAAIRDALVELDPLHAGEYRSACEEYTTQLRALDGDFSRKAEEAPLHTLLFADRFPFRYLTEDYGLDYYAAFAGCSSETEASFNTVIFLAEKAQELGLHHVLVIENSDEKLARTVIENAPDTQLSILTLHSMQGSVGEETYLSLMKQNLHVLEEALR